MPPEHQGVVGEQPEAKNREPEEQAGERTRERRRVADANVLRVESELAVETNI